MKPATAREAGALTPYAPPKARVAEAEAGAPPSTPLARSGRRFVNFLLDWVFAWLLTIACGFIVGVALGVLGVRGVNFNRVGQVLGILGFTIYYVVFEASFGWTLAKLITGTRVVDESGRKPSFRKVLGRSLARSVPFEPFSFLGRTGIGWHDRWSGTRVVSLRARAEAPAAPAWAPSEGPPASCPNCGLEITTTTTRCACSADFTAADGWKPLAKAPAGG